MAQSSGPLWILIFWKLDPCWYVSVTLWTAPALLEILENKSVG